MTSQAGYDAYITGVCFIGLANHLLSTGEEMVNSTAARLFFSSHFFFFFLIFNYFIYFPILVIKALH